MGFVDLSHLFRILIFALLIVGELVAWKATSLNRQIIEEKNKTIETLKEGKEADQRTITAQEKNIEIRKEKMGY